jgi:hypothetical protein
LISEGNRTPGDSDEAAAAVDASTTATEATAQTAEAATEAATESAEAATEPTAKAAEAAAESTEAAAQPANSATEATQSAEPTTSQSAEAAAQSAKPTSKSTSESAAQPTEAACSTDAANSANSANSADATDTLPALKALRSGCSAHTHRALQAGQQRSPRAGWDIGDESVTELSARGSLCPERSGQGEQRADAQGQHEEGKTTLEWTEHNRPSTQVMLFWHWVSGSA